VAWRGGEESALSWVRAETISRSRSSSRLQANYRYPVPGDDGSAIRRRRYNFLRYYPVSPGAALDDILTDDQGRLHDY
jgi:hypothetical protein